MSSLFTIWLRWRNNRNRRNEAQIFTLAHAFMLPYAFVAKLPTDEAIRAQADQLNFTGGYSSFERTLFVHICLDIKQEALRLAKGR